MAYVLIVDDDEDFAEATATVLRSCGHDVAIELSPEAGHSAVTARVPDLLILDVMFPENRQAGLELAAQLRREGDLAELPILVVSAVDPREPLGFGDDQDGKSRHPQITDFITKPFDLDIFIETVQRMLSGPPKASC